MWKILTEDTQKIIYWSNICPAEDQEPTLVGEPGSKPPVIFVRGRVEHDDPNGDPMCMPTFDPEDLLGRTFLLDHDPDGMRFRARIKHIAYDLWIKALISIDKGNKKIEEFITYAKHLEYIEKNEAEEDYPKRIWKFWTIIGHQGPLMVTEPKYKGSRYNVQVKWETRETTFEPLSVISDDDPITCAIYSKKTGLLNQQGWKHLKPYVRSHSRLIRNIKQSKVRQFRRSVKYKFGYQLPRDYDETMMLDRINGNEKWSEAIHTEIKQMDQYQVFQDKGKAIWDKGKITNSPEGYNKICVHLVFDVKHDGRHKAMLVADGHLANVPVEDIYSGVVSLQNLRLVVVLAELNDLEL
jgi:hypothetical protein